MEKYKKPLCKLCLSPISGLNFIEIDGVLREVLEVVLLKQNSDEEHQQVMCSTCGEKIYAAFEFKSTCFYTDDAIFPYVELGNPVPVDLKEIYMREIGTTELVEKEICRLCMKPIKEQFTSVHELDDKIFQKYIPEVNLSTTKNPVICKLCVDSVTTHSIFLKNCLDANTRTKHIGEKITDNPDVPNLDFSIKTKEETGYETKLKSGVNSYKIEETDSEEDSINIEESEITWENTEEERLQSSPHLIATPESRETKREGNSDPSKLDVFDYDICKGKAKYLPKLEKRVLIRNKTKKHLHECDICGYKCKFKSRLNMHMLTHKEASEIQWYECELCDQKFKTGGNFKQHMLVHTDGYEIQWYECNVCSYKSKQKYSLNSHMLIHKDASEIQWYKCNICKYKSKYKQNLSNHILIHKDASETQWYECNVCRYKSKLKGNLNNHMIIHKEASDIEWYKCNVCNYKCKVKTSLTRHMLTHRKPSEIPWSFCELCNKKFRAKDNLKRHMLIHRKPCEKPWYSCELCNRKYRTKSNVNQHKLRAHKDVSEIQWHCDVCRYKSKQISNLNNHMLIHKDASEDNNVMSVTTRPNINKV